MTTVLHIENDPDCLELSRIVLKRNGYRYLAANSIEFGLLLAEKENPDLIILSSQYADQSGLELARTIQKLPPTRSTPLVFFCPPEEYHDISSLIRSDNGFSIHHIEKPTTYRAFLDGISAVFDKADQ